jgi:hypothetical protein
MKYTVISLLVLVVSGLLIATPPVAVWRSLSRQASGPPVWFHPALWLIGPFVATFFLVVLLWLPAYSGQCGGWLGETTPCRGFGEYAIETVYWAALSIAMPGLLGLLLGLVVLISWLIRRTLARKS